MDKQEVFDIASKHLLTIKSRPESKYFEPNLEPCCAIGAVIKKVRPESLDIALTYDNGVSIGGVLTAFPDLGLLLNPNETLELLTDLQRVSDKCNRLEYVGALLNLADKHNLNRKVIENHANFSTNI